MIWDPNRRDPIRGTILWKVRVLNRLFTLAGVLAAIVLAVFLARHLRWIP